MGPTVSPLFVIVITFIDPSTALFLTSEFSEFVSQSWGTGMKSVDSNFTISLGFIV